MNIKNSEILITGGAGFIGSNLAIELVKQDAKVTIVDSMLSPYGGNLFNLKCIKDKVSFVEGDVRSSDLIEKIVKGKDCVVHLAAQTGRLISMKNPSLDYEINCQGTLNVLNALKKENKTAKFIFSSSRGVIGKPMYLPVDENHPAQPRDMYGIHKLTAEYYCWLYAREYNIPIIILRFNNVYGPRCQIKSNHYGTINLFIAGALMNKVSFIYGDGAQTRDYVYIDDTVDAIIKSINSDVKDELYFVASGKEYSLLDIVSYIKKHIPEAAFSFKAFPEEFGNIDFHRFVSTSNKIKDDLGWESIIPLDLGIKKTIEFYRESLANYL